MNYICKIASKEEIAKKFDYEISIHKEDEDNWIKWKEEALNIPDGKRIVYYGILDGKIICEATAAISKDACQNSDGLVDEKIAYLFAFRTNIEYRKQGYFSKLFNFMINDLKSREYTKVTLGVEPNELENKEIYFHYGFTEHIKDAIEYEPDGTAVDVEYYGKEI